MHFPLRRHDLWSVACFGDDGGDGDGGAGDSSTSGEDDANSADSGVGSMGDGSGAGADSSGVGDGGGGMDGGTTSGQGSSTASGGAEGTDGGGGGATTGSTDAMDTPGGFGPGGFGDMSPDEQAASEAQSAAQAQSEEDAFGGMHTNEQAMAGNADGSSDTVRGLLDFYGRNNSYSQVAQALGNAADALGIGGISESADSAVAGQEASAADAGAGDAGLWDDPSYIGYPQNDGTGTGTGDGTGAGDTSPTGWQRAGSVPVPDNLKDYLSPGMTDLQARTAIATGALYNSNPVYRTQEAKDYYNALLRNALINETGGFNDIGVLNPVERQYLEQSVGVGGYDDSESLLNATGMTEEYAAAVMGSMADQKNQPGSNWVVDNDGQAIV